MKKYLTADRKWWVLTDGNTASAGLTKQALSAYGELLVCHSHLAMPFAVSAQAPIAAIEGMHEFGCLSSPIAGRVLRFNAQIENDPSSISPTTALFDYDRITLSADLIELDNDALHGL